MRHISDLTLYSKSKLNQVANNELIEKTRDYKLINMFPIFPTIDLKTEHVYQDENSIGWSTNIANPYKNLHTIFHINDDQFNLNADVARLIMFAFGYAYAQSQLNKNVRFTPPLYTNLFALNCSC